MKIKYHNLALLIRFSNRQLLLKQQISLSVPATSICVIPPSVNVIAKYNIHPLHTTNNTHSIQPYIKFDQNNGGPSRF
mgnify:CR=1 FL=1|jgi:hypothetical protein